MIFQNAKRPQFDLQEFGKFQIRAGRKPVELTEVGGLNNNELVFRGSNPTCAMNLKKD